MFYVSIFILQIILIEAHYILYVTVKSIFGISNPEIRLCLKIIFAILSVSFLTASVFGHALKNKVVRFLYIFSSVWLGFLIYILIASALYWILLFGTGNLFSNQTLSGFGIIFFIAAILIGLYGIRNAKNIRLKSISVNISGIPEKWVGRKAVLISDVHLGQINQEKFSEKIAEKIKKLSPDILFIVGDLFDGMMLDAKEAIKPFEKLSIHLGKYFVTGNHELYGKNGGAQYTEAIRTAGIHILDDSNIIIEGVNIIGVDDDSSADRKEYEKILSKLSLGKNVSILLKHTPANNDIAAKHSISLQLSGHTHGGQFFPINLITPMIFKEQNYGLSSYQNTIVYTSSGIGTSVSPIRIGTTPEIVLIEFGRK